MSKHPSLLLAFLALWLLPVRPASAGEWEVGVITHTGAHGEIRPFT